MSRLDDINAVLEVADALLQKIQTEYDQSLSSKAISPKLSVYIKNYLENLRSSLDYIASEICEETLSISKAHKPYFPISCENNKAFNAHIDMYFPALDVVNYKLYTVLEELQSYKPSGCKALPKLSKLVNENKHNRLSPQTRTEKRGLIINFPAGQHPDSQPGGQIRADPAVPAAGQGRAGG